MPVHASTIGRSLATWALVSLLARAVVPSGFMLAAPTDGWPVAPCPGQDHGILHAADVERNHRDDPEHSDGCDSDCFLGLFFALTADLDAEVSTSSPPVETGPLPGDAEPDPATAEVGDARPRAPPLSG